MGKFLAVLLILGLLLASFFSLRLPHERIKHKGVQHVNSKNIEDEDEDDDDDDQEHVTVFVSAARRPKMNSISKQIKTPEGVDVVRTYVLKEEATHKVYPIYFGTDRMKPAIGSVVVTPNTKGLWIALMLCCIATVTVIVPVVASLMGWLVGPLVTSTQKACCIISALIVVVALGIAALAHINPIKQSVTPGVVQAFTEHRDDVTRYGVCAVSVPVNHTIGEVETPRYEVRPDPASHIVLQRVTTLTKEDFLEDLSTALGRCSAPDALIFVHGYNVSFENAARRTAQLAHDLKYKGLACFYSWPANGHTLAYTWDEQSVSTSVVHFQAFLETIASANRLKNIHIIAHSMGSRCVVHGLMKDLKLANCKIDQFILAAPDIDVEEFKQRVPGITAKVGRLTLYASSHDAALQLSHVIHQYPRAGDSGSDIVVMPQFESIDASNAKTDGLGHSYFGDSCGMISELGLVIEQRCPISDVRRGLLRIPFTATLSYWQIPVPKTK